MLTRSECKIMDLLAQGKGNHAIASSLDIAVKTVDTHLHHIREKTGLNSRVELALWWVKQSGISS